MTTLDKRISSFDTTLYKAIPSETTDEDKKSLLFLQNCVRNQGEYIYLEIGSHLGGTIQPYFVDPVCKVIYSIDKRPEFQPDERGVSYHYNNNSTDKMLNMLSDAYPSININKVKTFDSNASRVKRNKITKKPNLCFIDGEHTNHAVVLDFKFCLSISQPNTIIAFHDTGYIFKGIKTIKKYLSQNSIKFSGYKLAGSVYIILLNNAINLYADKVKLISINESKYFKNAKVLLYKLRLKNKYPQLYNFLWRVKKIMMN